MSNGLALVLAIVVSGIVVAMYNLVKRKIRKVQALGNLLKSCEVYCGNRKDDTDSSPDQSSSTSNPTDATSDSQHQRKNPLLDHNFRPGVTHLNIADAPEDSHTLVFAGKDIVEDELILTFTTLGINEASKLSTPLSPAEFLNTVTPQRIVRYINPTIAEGLLALYLHHICAVMMQHTQDDVTTGVNNKEENNMHAQENTPDKQQPTPTKRKVGTPTTDEQKKKFDELKKAREQQEKTNDE